MRRYLFFIVFLILIVWLGIQLRTDPGYVLLTTENWAIEMPLWLTIVALFIGFIVLYTVIRVFKYGGSLSGRWNHWSAHRRKASAIKTTNQGLIELAEGNWKKSEKLLCKGADDSDEPLLNYLALALAAQGQKNYEQRAEYLHQAHNIEPNADMAIGLTQAQLQCSHHQYEQALATLHHLHELNPKQQQVLRLLKHLYSKLGNWREARNLLPSLKKYAGYPEENYMAIASNIYQHMFGELSHIADVEKNWNELPSKFQQQAEISQAYVKRLIDLNAFEKAETVIRKQLKKQWLPLLVSYYGEIDVDAKAQLQVAIKWLTEHKQDASLLYALGILSARNELWGQAYDYYQASLAINPASNVYLLLGQLCEKMGKMDEGRDNYRKGLMQKN